MLRGNSPRRRASPTNGSANSHTHDDTALRGISRVKRSSRGRAGSRFLPGALLTCFLLPGRRVHSRFCASKAYLRGLRCSGVPARPPPVVPHRFPSPCVEILGQSRAQRAGGVHQIGVAARGQHVTRVAVVGRQERGDQFLHVAIPRAPVPRGRARLVRSTRNAASDVGPQAHRGLQPPLASETPLPSLTIGPGTDRGAANADSRRHPLEC